VFSSLGSVINSVAGMVDVMASVAPLLDSETYAVVWCQNSSRNQTAVPSARGRHNSSCEIFMDRPTDTPDVLGSLDRLRQGIHAGRDETRLLVDAVLEGTVDLDRFGHWLLALADLGESADEIAGVAEALRGRMLPVHTTHAVVADTCGTGGDGCGSFNISTTAAIIAAAAGLPVAKHGNRAVTSRTGSADVLEQLGVAVGVPPETSAHLLEQEGFCFCLAPVHHPAMARVGPLRRSLGRPTVFNLVGPLCNPAGATVQVIGVGRATAREPLAEAARLLGAKRTLVVSGHVGDDPNTGPNTKVFDEISLFGPTDVIDVSAGATTRSRWTPEDFGIAMQPADRLAELTVASPAESAAAIRDVLAGAHGPRRDVVVLNTAAVLWTAGRASDLPTARATAEAAIDTGAAAHLLLKMVAATKNG
jgi:anthranilate phosphoribosyltransferase